MRAIILLILLRTAGVPVLIEDHEIIILRHVLAQSEVLLHKTKQLGAGSIVRQFLGQLTFLVHHHVEQGLAVTAALHALVHVEVEDANRAELLDDAVLITDEQVALADLDEADDLVALRANVQPVVTAEQAAGCRDDRGQFLCFG